MKVTNLRKKRIYNGRTICPREYWVNTRANPHETNPWVQITIRRNEMALLYVLWSSKKKWSHLCSSIGYCWILIDILFLIFVSKKGDIGDRFYYIIRH
jgi:hypothetical protein